MLTQEKAGQATSMITAAYGWSMLAQKMRRKNRRSAKSVGSSQVERLSQSQVSRDHFSGTMNDFTQKPRLTFIGGAFLFRYYNGIIECYGKQSRRAVGAHGHTVEYTGTRHGLAIVRDQYELGMF